MPQSRRGGANSPPAVRTAAAHARWKGRAAGGPKQGNGRRSGRKLAGRRRRSSYLTIRRVSDSLSVVLVLLLRQAAHLRQRPAVVPQRPEGATPSSNTTHYDRQPAASTTLSCVRRVRRGAAPPRRLQRTQHAPARAATPHAVACKSSQIDHLGSRCIFLKITPEK
jgi:hypothetical protein